MKILRRILIGFAILFASQYFVVPAVILYFARNAPAVASVAPTDLKDLSVSQAPGAKLSYLGYEFDVPWNDLDESKTEVLDDEPDERTAGLCFRSGLRLFMFVSPLHKDYYEYTLLKRAYAITPEQIHYWGLFTGRHYGDARLLLLKSALLRGIGLGSDSNPAETGIFNIQTAGHTGFPYGDPQKWQPILELKLYSDDNTVKIDILQKDYNDPMGVTQPEINRILQSLNKTAPADSSKPLTTASN